MAFANHQITEWKHSSPKVQRARQLATEVKIEKSQVKKKLRGLRRSGDRPEVVETLAREFHLLIRRLSKLNKVVKVEERRWSANLQRKECRKDIHKFARRVLDEDNCSSILPTFSSEVAEDYFRTTYASEPRQFDRPTWMPQPHHPTVPMDTDPFTLEEVEAVISRTCPNSSPSPLDQVPYTVLKRCRSLMPALLHLYNTCWSNQVAPQAWKVGTIQLIGKSKAKQDPSQPSHFRPIALTPCIGKVFTSLLKLRWLSYMLSNGYLGTSTQKAFVDGISGCTEHHLKLLSMIREARQKHKSLCIAWLDLANAFGSVNHGLISFSLTHYHAPVVFTNMVSELYTGLLAIIRTKSWTTSPHLTAPGCLPG